MPGIKIYPADDWFSKCIREGNNNSCEMCGRSGIKMETHHYEGRRNFATRFEPLNCCCLCYSCHRKAHESPDRYKDFLVNKIGVMAYDVLKEKILDKALIAKQLRHEKKELSKYFRDQYREILDKRAKGETRRIEVVGY